MVLRSHTVPENDKLLVVCEVVGDNGLRTSTTCRIHIPMDFVLDLMNFDDNCLKFARAKTPIVTVLPEGDWDIL